MITVTVRHLTAVALGGVLTVAATGWSLFTGVKGYLDNEQTKQVQRIQERDKRDAALDARLSNIEKHLQLIDQTLPEHDRQMMQIFQAQAQQIQAVRDQQNQVPVLAMHRMKTLDVPAVAAEQPAADQPAEEKPQ